MVPAHLIFVVTTSLDIFAFYFLGRWLNKDFETSRLVKFAKRWLGMFDKFAGKNGQRISVFLFGSIIFPAPAFLAPWLDIPFWEIFVLLFFGDVIFWYCFEWLIVLGVKTFISPQLALYSIIGISLVLTVLIKYISRKFTKKPTGR